MTPRADEPRVRIEEVTFPPIPHNRLVDRHLDQPRLDAPVSGDTTDIYALKVRGWAIGDGQPVTHFELVHRGMVLETVPALSNPALAALRPDDEFAGQSRIELAVSALDLPYTFRVAVRAVLQDDARARVAVLSGRRAPLPDAPAVGPTPVLVTMIGRTGSTAVSNLLCHHPDFAGYRTWDTETRAVSYWTSVLRALARPASYERQLQPTGPMQGNWWVGAQAPNPDLPDDEPALPALGRLGVEELAAFCRSQIGLIGSSLAEAAGKPGARYLVEKAAAHWVRSVAEVSEELDPRTREIVLVRDFRDVACSMLAYSREKRLSGFGPKADATIEDTIHWLSQNGAAGLVDYIERRGASAHVLRYEDLITQPAVTLSAVLEHIGAEARPQTVALMLEQLAAERERRDSHATTESAHDSLGRWRRELDADQQALAEQVFRPQLDALGYE